MASMRISFKPFWAFLGLLLLWSCSNDDDNPGTDPPIPATITIENFSATLAENPSNTNLALGTISATTDSGEIIFSLEDQNPAGAFAINAETGALEVADVALFDFEVNPILQATVVATVGDQRKTATVTITLTDVDETAITADNFTASLDENPTNGQVIGTVNASATVGDLNFTINSQTPDGAMAINATTGELTVANAGVFDFETNPTISAEILVTANTQSETIIATISLNDVTEAVAGSIPFIFTWEVGAGESIRLPRGSGFTYDYTVDWGDGTIESIDANTGGTTHVYANAGVYTVEITGSYPWAPFNSLQLRDAIRTVEQWGNIQWEQMANMFQRAGNLTINATDTPDLSLVADMSSMFEDTSIGSPDFSNWNTTNVTTMQRTFKGASSFNGNISTWDVSNVTNMESMFIDAHSFNNDISGWNPEKVTDMEFLFSGARSFNQDISSWNVGQVTTMLGVFSGAQVFNQNINGWDVSNVENMALMFRNASDFNQNLNSWDVSKVTNMQGMFNGADDFNGNINNWNVANVINMASMFAADGGSAKGSAAATKFNQDIGGWDVSQVTNMSRMFEDNTDFNQNLNGWNVGSVTNMARMFEGATSFDQPLGDWNVSAVTTMSRMFLNATAFNQNINGWNVAQVEIMDSMFNGSVSYNQPLNSWNVTGARNMSFLFRNANSFNQDLSSWDVSNVNFFVSMFEQAAAFNQDLSAWQFSALSNRLAMQGILDNSGLSTQNYDALLNSLANQASGMPLNIDFRGSGLVYCAAATSHNQLTSTYNWTFTDTLCTP